MGNKLKAKVMRAVVKDETFIITIQELDNIELEKSLFPLSVKLFEEVRKIQLASNT